MTLAGTFDQSNSFNRPVTPQQSDKSRTPDRPDTRSPQQKAADYWESFYDGEKREQQQREAARRNEQAQKLEAERQEQERKRQQTEREAARGAYEFNVSLIEAELDKCGLSADEKALVWNGLTEAGNETPEFAYFLAASIKAARDQGQARIRCLRDLATPEQWATVMKALSRPDRAGYSLEEIATGAAHSELLHRMKGHLGYRRNCET